MPNDLAPDVARKVADNSRRLVPAGPAVPGHRLTVTGVNPSDPSDIQYAWRQPEDKQVREGNGDPNGNVTAPKGTLYVERDVPSLWQNSDGLTAWTEIGSGFASTNYWQFLGGSTPELLLDPTNTAGIENFYVALGTGDRTRLAMNDEGGTAGASDQFVSANTSGDITLTAGADVVIGADAELNLSGATVFLGNLPSSDPSVPGQLYQLSGVVMVSL